jgi:hypothetical protein
VSLIYDTGFTVCSETCKQFGIVLRKACVRPLNENIILNLNEVHKGVCKEMENLIRKERPPFCPLSLSLSSTLN